MSLPLAGYTVTIDMMMEVVPLANKTYDIFDWGSANDAYTSELVFRYATAEAEPFSEIIEDTSRGQAVSLGTIIGVVDGFYPFGPHVSVDTNTHVYVIDYDDVGKWDPFGKAWEYKLKIAPAQALTIHSEYEVICAGGGFRIGSLNNFHLPVLTPSIEYKVFNSRFGSGTYMHYNYESSKHKTVSMAFQNIEKEGARNILIELVRNTRGANTTLNAGSNNWPFSLRDGQGDKTVKLANTRITAANTAGNIWNVNCEVIDAD